MSILQVVVVVSAAVDGGDVVEDGAAALADAVVRVGEDVVRTYQLTACALTEQEYTMRRR